VLFIDEDMFAVKGLAGMGSSKIQEHDDLGERGSCSHWDQERWLYVFIRGLPFHTGVLVHARHE